MFNFHVKFLRSPKCLTYSHFLITKKLHILSSLQSRDSRPLLLVLTLLFTFQFNHLQHHDSSVVYILNAYDLSVHSSIGCTCKMYVRTSVVITFALPPSYTDKHIFFCTFVRFTNICMCECYPSLYILLLAFFYSQQNLQLWLMRKMMTTMYVCMYTGRNEDMCVCPFNLLSTTRKYVYVFLMQYKKRTTFTTTTITTTTTTTEKKRKTIRKQH